MGIDEFYEGVSMQTTTGLGSETLQDSTPQRARLCVLTGVSMACLWRKAYKTSSDSRVIGGYFVQV